MQYTNTIGFLNTFARQVISEMRTRLEGFGKVATGRLHQTMTYSINADLTLSFHLESYAPFVDKGRRPGKMPPLEPIKSWCRVKNIPESAAYPIALKIAREGITPTNFMSTTINRRQKQFQKGIEVAMAKDLENLF